LPSLARLSKTNLSFKTKPPVPTEGAEKFNVLTLTQKFRHCITFSINCNIHFVMGRNWLFGRIRFDHASVRVQEVQQSHNKTLTVASLGVLE